MYTNKKSAGNRKVVGHFAVCRSVKKPHPCYTRNSSVPANNIIHYFIKIVKYILVALQRNFCAVWFRHAAFFDCPRKCAGKWGKGVILTLGENFRETKNKNNYMEAIVMGENRSTQENGNQGNQGTQTAMANEPRTKFCKHCGEKIDAEAVLCIKCGKQIEELKGGAEQPKIEVNVSQSQSSVNTNTNTINAGMLKTPKNKWVAFFLCLFAGVFGVHKFYEGKAGMGILYIFTAGLFGVGVLVDLIAILLKPNPYYV